LTGRGEIAPVHDRLELEVQNIGDLFAGAREIVVAALTHHVEQQHRALAGIHPDRSPAAHPALLPAFAMGDCGTGGAVSVFAAAIPHNCLL